MSVRLIIMFPNEDALAAWGAAQRGLGGIPDEGGIRQADALDPEVDGRAHRGEFILTKNVGICPWLIPPVGVNVG